jgi:hypothetical protein
VRDFGVKINNLATAAESAAKEFGIQLNLLTPSTPLTTLLSLQRKLSKDFDRYYDICLSAASNPQESIADCVNGFISSVEVLGQYLSLVESRIDHSESQIMRSLPEDGTQTKSVEKENLDWTNFYNSSVSTLRAIAKDYMNKLYDIPISDLNEWKAYQLKLHDNMCVYAVPERGMPDFVSSRVDRPLTTYLTHQVQKWLLESSSLRVTIADFCTRYQEIDADTNKFEKVQTATQIFAFMNIGPLPLFSLNRLSILATNW